MIGKDGLGSNLEFRSPSKKDRKCIYRADFDCDAIRQFLFQKGYPTGKVLKKLKELDLFHGR